MSNLNQKTKKTTPSIPQSTSSHSSHKPWLGQAQQWPQQEPQALSSSQSAWVDKAQEKEPAKEAVEEAVEEAVKEAVEEVEEVVEEVAILKELTIPKNEKNYLHPLTEEAQKRLLTSPFKWPPIYNSTNKSTPLKKINGISLSADSKEEQQGPGQPL